MPAPNGELVVFLLVWAVVFIITVASDRVDWPEFTTATVFLAAAYMISRGIGRPALPLARASKRCAFLVAPVRRTAYRLVPCVVRGQSRMGA